MFRADVVNDHFTSITTTYLLATAELKIVIVALAAVGSQNFRKKKNKVTPLTGRRGP